MPSCTIARLSDRGVLRVAGADARKFLQGLVTNDMDTLSDGAALHAGLLTPQGKILFDFFVVQAREGYFLDCPAAERAQLLQRLAFYKLRAAVDLIDLSREHQVWAAWGGRPHVATAQAIYADPRLPELGLRFIAPHDTVEATGCAEADEADYHARRIALGVPEGGRDYAFGDAFPHEADFDQLNGVSFTKGCFVGQEVVSRMQHRGTARKRIVPIEGAAELAPGAAIVADGTPLGSVGSVAGRQALALIRLDRAQEAIRQGKALMAGEVAIRLRQPSWATFRVLPEEGA